MVKTRVFCCANDAVEISVNSKMFSSKDFFMIYNFYKAGKIGRRKQLSLVNAELISVNEILISILETYVCMCRRR
jgi:hypothetical protein